MTIHDRYSRRLAIDAALSVGLQFRKERSANTDVARVFLPMADRNLNVGCDRRTHPHIHSLDWRAGVVSLSSVFQQKPPGYYFSVHQPSYLVPQTPNTRLLSEALPVLLGADTTDFDRKFTITHDITGICKPTRSTAFRNLIEAVYSLPSVPLPLTPEKDPTYLMELAIARKLSEIDSIRVDLFAATFASQGKPTQGAQVRVGWNRSQFRSISRNSIACVNEETAFFEVEVEVPDLRAHAGAMGYLRNSIALLDGFAPYQEIKPLAGDRAGEPRFERATGTWLYSAIFSAVWTLTNGQPPELHLIADLPTDITVILKSARAQPIDFELSEYEEIS